MAFTSVNRFLIGLLGSSLFFSTAFAAPEAKVAVNGLFSTMSVSDDWQSLSTIDITNTALQRLDVRRVVLKNEGTLSLKTALDDIQIISKGKPLSTRFVFREDWDAVTSELKHSEVEFWLKDVFLDDGETLSVDVRAKIKGLEKGLTFVPAVAGVSVKMDDADLIRDIELDVSAGGLVTEALVTEGGYAPVMESADSDSLLPDLAVERIRFVQKRGYAHNVFVIPVCNKGTGKTPDGQRIEATVYAPDTLRDFILRRSLAPGKCFEQILSAKRDLEVNATGDHRIRVELDQQNIIKELRENNNERLDTVSISSDVALNTNTRKLEVLSDSPRQVIRKNVRPRRPRVARKNVQKSEKVRGTSRRGTSEALRRYKESLQKVQKARSRYRIHPEYGNLKNRTQASEVKKELLNIKQNDIVREELPKTQEDTWKEQAWERGPYKRRWTRRSRATKVAPPNQLEKKIKRPTFREPNTYHKRRVSYRALRAGFRAIPDYSGQRSNNEPEFETKNNFEAFCKDSDGLNFFEQGTVEYKTQRMVTGKTAMDETRGPYVLEYYCEGDYMRRKLFECEEVGNGMCEK